MKQFLCICFLLTFFCHTYCLATDYTRMAQEIARSSREDTSSQQGHVKDFLQALPKSDKSSLENYELYLHPNAPNLTQGKSCRKGRLTPVDRSRIPGSKTEEETKVTASQYQFLIFVSLGLPDSVLLALHDQAIRYGGRLVIRGLRGNSFPQTQSRMKDLGITVDIHPIWFEEYSVDRVPTFVVSHQDNKALFDKVSGNVSCQDALEVFARDGSLKDVSLQILKGADAAKTGDF